MAHEPVSGEAGGGVTPVAAVAVAVASGPPAAMVSDPPGAVVSDPPAAQPSGRRSTLDGTVDIARDRDLVERCQQGDPSAFAELYHRYHRRLQRFCLRRLHGPDDAEEAVQEAFTRAWRALPRFGGERRFYPWLTVIAANVCTDILRRRSRLVPMDEVPVRPSELSETEVDEQLLRQVDLAMATEALGHLSDRHQRVLRLREGSGWTAQMIAEHEGVAVPAVDTLLWRARQAFKREFAALADAGGRFAGVLGLGAVAGWRVLWRTGARSTARAASLAPVRLRGPGAWAASVALAGAAAAGGGIALAGSGPSQSGHTSTPSTGSPSTQPPGPASGPGSGVGGSTGAGSGQSGSPTPNSTAGTPAPGSESSPGGPAGSINSVPGTGGLGQVTPPGGGIGQLLPPLFDGTQGSGSGGLTTTLGGLGGGLLGDQTLGGQTLGGQTGTSGVPPIAGSSTQPTTTTTTSPTGVIQSTVTTALTKLGSAVTTVKAAATAGL